MPSSSAARSSVRATHTVPASHPSALLYRPDTTPATAPSLSRITGAPLIPGTTALAVIRPSGTASSHIVRPVHWPDRGQEPVRCGRDRAITQCPVTVTGVRGAIWSVAVSSPAAAGRGAAQASTARSCTGSKRATAAPNACPPASGSTRTRASSCSGADVVQDMPGGHQHARRHLETRPHRGAVTIQHPPQIPRHQPVTDTGRGCHDDPADGPWGGSSDACAVSASVGSPAAGLAVMS